MKQTDLSSVGGRIRQARIDASLKMQELSKLVGITAAYQGMIERDEKNPSDELLKKIAKATDSSFNWLQTGQEDEDKPAVPVNPLQQTPVPTNVDIPLFLSLVLQSTHDMTKDRLAARLDVTPAILENILAGKDYEPDAPWVDYCSLLARQMDLPAVCRKLRDLDLFLQNENMKQKRERLYSSLKRYAGPEYPYFIPPLVQNKMENDKFGGKALYSEHIVLQKSASPQKGTWHFTFYPYVDESMVNELMEKELEYKMTINGELTLVFTDKKILERCKDNYNSRSRMYNSLEWTDYSCQSPFPISLLLVDSDTWEVKGEIVQLKNDFQDDESGQLEDSPPDMV